MVLVEIDGRGEGCGRGSSWVIQRWLRGGARTTTTTTTKAKARGKRGEVGEGKKGDSQKAWRVIVLVLFLCYLFLNQNVVVGEYGAAGDEADDEYYRGAS